MVACSSHQDSRSVAIIAGNSEQASGTHTDGLMPGKSRDICWTGTLDGKIPVFIHYQLDGAVIIGTITYLDTKTKTPIRLLGSMGEEQEYRLLEFDPAGKITVIITGIPDGKSFKGTG